MGTKQRGACRGMKDLVIWRSPLSTFLARRSPVRSHRVEAQYLESDIGQHHVRYQTSSGSKANSDLMEVGYAVLVEWSGGDLKISCTRVQGQRQELFSNRARDVPVTGSTALLHLPFINGEMLNSNASFVSQNKQILPS